MSSIRPVGRTMRGHTAARCILGARRGLPGGVCPGAAERCPERQLVVVQLALLLADDRADEQSLAVERGPGSRSRRRRSRGQLADERMPDDERLVLALPFTEMIAPAIRGRAPVHVHVIDHRGADRALRVTTDIPAES